MGGLFAWSAVGLALTALLSWLVWRWRGDGQRVRIADWLTILRLALVAPTVWLLLKPDYPAAAFCYAALAASDIADGVIARRRRETSLFGTFLDPLADVLSTLAVFTVLVAGGLVPLWLYLILLVRYLMLGAGSLAISRARGPLEFRSTLPGKIVGVIQAAAVLWILAARVRGPAVPGAGPLFAFLGLGFVSIVISQAIIGYRHVRRVPPRARG
ncbi:MAG TPA: CDP-alcohol phosphatidyltransferase family protein [Candidatus Krumholzibacteria bacterium]